MKFHIDGGNAATIPVVILMIAFWILGIRVHIKTYRKRNFQKEEKSRYVFIAGCVFFQVLFLALDAWFVWLLFFA